jgi:hypothetical protein
MVKKGKSEISEDELRVIKRFPLFERFATDTSGKDINGCKLI